MTAVKLLAMPEHGPGYYLEPQEGTIVVRCIECDEWFPNNGLLGEHLARVHPEIAKLFGLAAL